MHKVHLRSEYGVCTAYNMADLSPYYAEDENF